MGWHMNQWSMAGITDLIHSLKVFVGAFFMTQVIISQGELNGQ